VEYRRVPIAIALLVLVCGLASSVVAAAAWDSVLTSEAKADFARSALSVGASLGAQVDALTVATGAVRSELHTTTPGAGLDVATFDAAAGAGLADLPPGVVVRVAYVQPASTVDELLAMRAEVRRSGLSEFNISNQRTGSDHMIATFEAPSTQPSIFAGLDLASLPATRAALNQARAEGTPVITDVFDSLPDDAIRAHPTLGRSGLGLVIPVYQGGETPPPEARRDDLVGWVMAVVSAQVLVEHVAQPADPGLVVQLANLADVDVEGATPLSEASPIASTSVDAEGRVPSVAGTNPDFVRTIPVDRVGRRWSLTVARPSEGDNGAAAITPALVLAGGAALSVLLSGFVWSVAGTRASALRLAERASADVRRTEAQFRALVQNLPDLIVVTDDARSVTYVSPSVTSLLGWSVDEAVGAPLFDLIHPEEQGRFERILSHGSGDESFGARVRCRDGGYLWFEGKLTNLTDDPAVGGLVITAHDITDQKALEDRLAHDATHDVLTDLPNRVIIHDRLDHALERAERDGSRAAAIFLDIDQFKAVNDTWGHAAGDELLCEVAQRVRRAARSADTVGRYGGDEFVVICEDLPTVDEARVVAERIKDSVARPARVGGEKIRVRTSIGVALNRATGDTSSLLLGRADAAMYRAKESGAGRIVIDG